MKYENWLHGLWNTDPAELERLAPDVVSADFIGHWPGRTVHGPAELAEVIRQGRAMVDDMRFEIVVGPVAQGDLVAARWVGRGRYEGRPVEFHGHDLLRVAGDRFVEYWVIAEDPTAG
ncbi:SnoaL-like domain-containing protein [Amycolatopsis arida]|uniref:SnoaL-like domain-containing protein n=1 Tax=Amycolatopsis arida TaxID=587909 RepID=A0A1I5TZL9_9PSEU|nr:nuclear transport factor 2 family protein [Amycolatopsis arida]TDX95889.1 SnoaL-like protein [Amycolatopsis arida]SFP88505.1 SnoaL-like domain-containing protein [Amycolatopsis arida]